MIGGYGRGWRHRRMYYATGMPGYGRGRCFWAAPPPEPPYVAYPEMSPGRAGPYWPSARVISKKDELKMLEEEEQLLRQELEEVAARIKELSKATKEE